MSLIVRKVVMGGCVALLMAGCAASEADRKGLQQGYADYNARHLDSAEAAATAFIQKNPNVQNIDEAYYLRALARLGKGLAG